MPKILNPSTFSQKYIHNCEDCGTVSQFDNEEIVHCGPGLNIFVIKCPGCKTQFFNSIDKFPGYGH